MLYKTIVLETLQAHPQLHHQLRESRQLLAAVELCSTTLRTRHLEWIAVLSKKSPGRNPDQTAQEAFEIALEEFESHLPPAAPSNDLTLDAAMAYVLGHMQAE
jgi:hypothetical protein